MRTVEGERPVRAREAHGEERDRMWARFAEVNEGLDRYAQRATPTAVVVLEPR